jgi:hypothetical protein
MAANKKEIVAQVTERVALTTDVDYMITGEQPFDEAGSIDIQATEHAVVIIKKVKPSDVIASWLNHIYINGAQAVSGTNCQVKMYDRGTIVLPYGKGFQPLTCYTDVDFGGMSCSTYSEGHSGGFMKTLTSAELYNQFRSFRLKRGYMVTFALGTAGWGYSRCFIAADADLEMNLPANMAGRVSSYRLFKWLDVHKAGLASNGNAEHNAAVGSGWCYDWGTGNESLLPNVDWVANHIYEDYPSAAACGSRTGTCHMKTNNEPGNSSDDHPQTVEEVLNNWQNLMRTGMRLCSETSHDGSIGHLEAFLDSIDARGWRCDVVDMHCYWGQSSFYGSGYGMDRFYSRFGGRPIWISEWVWGASWGNTGIFSAVSDRDSFTEETQRICLNGTKPILEHLNACRYVERYAYWNAERNCSKIYKDGELSLLGQYYASMDEGLGYDAAIQKVPNIVYRPSSDLTARFDDTERIMTLAWSDHNGDMLDSMVVECQKPGTTTYQRVASINLKDASSTKGASYSLQTDAENGTNRYRIAIYPVGKTTPNYSNSATVLVISDKAEWSDVTEEYVVNAGFDVAADFQLSDLATGEANHKPVTGWITECNYNLGCAGSYKIGSSYRLNGQTPPAKKTEGEAQGGVLGVNQGWNLNNFYTQTVTLPAGTYRLTYSVYNALGTGSFIKLCGYKVGTKQPVYDNLTQMATGKWQVRTMNSFILTDSAEVVLSLGYTSAGGTSTSNPYLFFDYVKIEKADLSNVDDGGHQIVYVDVTNDVFTNPGFDVESDFQPSNLATGSANHKKVTGWTTTCNYDLGCAAVFAVGSSNTLNGKAAPSKAANGMKEGGVLGINQGWNLQNNYTQTVTLPAGTYVLSYAIWNAANASSTPTSLCGFKIGTKSYVYDNPFPLSVESWQIRTMPEFTLEEESPVTFSLGYTAGGSTSTSHPFVFFDYVHLEKAIVWDNATGITGVGSNVLQADHRVYNLLGQCVGNNAAVLQRLPRGIYVVNGRKVMVK